MGHLWHRAGDPENQFRGSIDQHKPFRLDRHGKKNQDQPVIRPHHAIGQQQSKYRTGSTNGRVNTGAHVLHEQLDKLRQRDRRAKVGLSCLFKISSLLTPNPRTGFRNLLRRLRFDCRKQATACPLYSQRSWSPVVGANCF